MTLNAYVLNSANKLSVIDTGTNTLITSISVGTAPQGMAVTLDGTKTYVTNGASNTVSVIDNISNTVVTTIPVGTLPLSVVISSDNARAYVCNQDSDTISVINVSTNTVTTTITLAAGTSPSGLALTPNGAELYVANIATDTVQVINTKTNTITSTISVSNNPRRITITQDGTKAYVGHVGAITVINTATKAVIGSPISIVGVIYGIAVNEAGTKVYFTNAGTSLNYTGVLDTATLGVSYLSTGRVGGICFTPDWTKIYLINNGSNSITVVDEATLNITNYTIGTSPLSGFGQFIQPPSQPITGTDMPAPQGRLTLISNTPVMTADATAQTNVYYTPYQGNIVPIYDGANMQFYAFGQLTMALNTSNQLSGNIYDLFVFINSSVVTFAAGPAWTSTSSRGTGANTTELTQIGGLWVNANIITLKNGATTYSNIPVGRATYVGSVYMTANGQTGVQFRPTSASGGNNTILGIWNAYNRVRVNCRSVDATSVWNYSTNAWRAANNSTSNRIRWLDGLQQSSIYATYDAVTNNNISTGQANIGIGFNSTSSPGGLPAQMQNNPALLTLHTASISPPLLGLNYAQALEITVLGTQLFYGNLNELVLETDM